MSGTQKPGRIFREMTSSWICAIIIFLVPVRLTGRAFSTLKYAPKSRGKPPDSLKDGHVLVGYTINSRGRAKDVKVIESEPPGIMDKALVSTH